MRRLGWIASVIVVLQCAFSVPLHAQSVEKGLLITPPRQYLTVDPGKSVKSSITVANLTENALTVRIAVEQFSVANYTYDYMFESVKEDWIKLEQTEVTLKKSESRTISYIVSPPKDAAPGGHYFTIFASTSLGEGRQIRTATVLYATVDGELRRSSSIVGATVPMVSFGGDIPFQLDVKATGNTHFIIYTSATIRGLLPFPVTPPNEVAHVLLPDTVRTIKEKFSPPLLPGIYQATYGYRDEEGHEQRQASYLVYAPPWAIALFIGILWFVVAFIKRQKRLKKVPATDS